MKLFSAFKTLPWEQRDSERRAAAVRDENAPELIAKLAEIAAQDAEPTVRRAALARIGDVAFLLERQRLDADAPTKAAAGTRLQRLLLDPSAGLPLEKRLGALSLNLPADLVERIAEAAPETALRRAALQRITRAGFLQRRCVDDPDAALREEALARIEGEEVLDRLAEALRKRDKNLARRARDRVHAMRLARGDAATLQQYALGLCDELARWAQQLPDDVTAQLEKSQAAWEAQRASFDAAMQRRVDAYFDRVQAALAMREGRAAAALQPVEPTIENIDAAVEEAVPEAAPATMAKAPPPEPVEFDEALKAAERAVAAQQLGEARPAFDKARGLLGTLARGDRGRRERFAKVEERLDELDQWQRWSGNRVRARLCEDVEALIAGGHHPDAVAHRVRELQQEWAKVEAAEPGDADRTSGLARRFRALCGKAMAPTRPYFEQRHALREQRRVALEAVVAQADEERLAGLSTPALLGVRRQLTEALRNLDELEPKARSVLAKRLREGLTRIDAGLSAQREDAALGRRKLIAKLRRELTHADPQTALELARNAQLEWKTLPRPAREQEAALEQELRALIDPLFTREREQRERSTQEIGRVESESKRLLAEIEALASGDAETLAHAEGRIAALQTAWRELHAKPEAPAETRERAPAGRDRNEARDRGRDGGRAGPRDRNDTRRNEPRPPRPVDTDRPLDNAIAKVRRAQAELEASRRGARLRAIADAAQLFAGVAQGDVGSDEAQARWSELPLDEADRRRLAARWQDAAGTPASDAADVAIETWLVEAELDAGLESPPQAQALRRQQQMQRLAVKLQGAKVAASDPLERLLQFAQLPAGSAAQSAQRFERLSRLVQAWA